jgi:hypothetical protein
MRVPPGKTLSRKSAQPVSTYGPPDFSSFFSATFDQGMEDRVTALDGPKWSSYPSPQVGPGDPSQPPNPAVFTPAQNPSNTHRKEAHYEHRRKRQHTKLQEI